MPNEPSVKTLVSEKLMSFLRFSHPLVVQYTAAISQNANSPEEIVDKLLEYGVDGGDAIRSLAADLFLSVSRKAAAQGSNSRRDEVKKNEILARKQRQYRLIVAESDEDKDHDSGTGVAYSSNFATGVVVGEDNNKKKRMATDDREVIRALRKKSRQEYLKKREKEKLQQLDDWIVEGLELSEVERLMYKHNKEILEANKKFSEYVGGSDGGEYRFPEAYDGDGLIDQRRRFGAASKRDTGGFEKLESWEDHQLQKATVKFGSKNRKREADDYQLLFDDSLYKLEGQLLPGKSLDDEITQKLDYVSKKHIGDGRKSLPIYQFKDKLLQMIRDNQVLVIVGETGSGKTTQVPQYLHEAGYTKQGKIICTQPRRVAAMSVAARVAVEMGVKLGHEVGFKIRFEDCTSEKTVVEYMTDGMLLREFSSQPDLKNCSVIMVDEAHERTVSTDIIFSLVKDLARQRSDLKLLISSATLDAEKFSDYFDCAPILEIPGRQYPVDILYKQPVDEILEEAVAATLHIHVTQQPGDILVFLTGQEDIETVEEMLREKVKHYGSKMGELIIHPLFANLPTELQARIFDPIPEKARKVILATNIAETSLTIEGIRYVIDSGLCKLSSYSPRTDMGSLQVTDISKASAMQRAGRAGRTGPGKCIRLYAPDHFQNQMEDNCVPEIQRSDIVSVVLTLKALGINDFKNFDFMDPPSDESMIKALELLYALGALNSKGDLTRIGKLMAEFPLDPKLSRMLIAAEKYGCAEEVMTIAAMLSVDNAIFYSPKNLQAMAENAKKRFEDGDVGDHIALLRVYNSWKETDFSSGWCRENFIQARSMKRARDVRDQLMNLMEKAGIELNSNPNDLDAIKKAIMSGFFPHIGILQGSGSYRILKGLQNVQIHPKSGMARVQPNPRWVVFHELVLTRKEYMRHVSEVKPKWLLEIAPHYYERKELEKFFPRLL
ncbi:unnamed protein product [Linum trigynum]|uniref:RNA helicase n=1 Tax=Linum trigynum TaxID=586398 RepID=A0AAV2CN47_9ROSI